MENFWTKWAKEENTSLLKRSLKLFRPLSCHILNAPSEIEGAKKWLVAMGPERQIPIRL